MAISQTSAHELGQLLELSALAADDWSQSSTATRSLALQAIAGGLESAAGRLIPIGVEETHLPTGRLEGELKRTVFQLRLFAEVLVEGSFLGARIDLADADWGMGPRPDIRRILEPLGPVLVFAASNFPFAFSGAGGDTASALAAGCSVILKAHSGHPRLSVATGEVVNEALGDVGAPEGLYSIVFGTDAGRMALFDPRVKAGSFTGSIAGGRTLFDLANSRPEPIPFYAEMGSVNPVFVTQAASAARAGEIAEGFLASFTLSAGQFCTKPGLLVVPSGSPILDLVRERQLPPAAALLNDRIQSGYLSVLQELSSHQSVHVVVDAGGAYADPPTATILRTTIEDLLADPVALLAECFGPASLLVTYDDPTSLLDLARILEGQLTASIQGEESDNVAELVRLLAKRAGRLLWNQWPTGVSVTYAQQHGGPYPASSSPGATSVGTAAILRFLRPVAYQGFPQALVPEAVRDDNPLRVPQRVNGRMVLP